MSGQVVMATYAAIIKLGEFAYYITSVIVKWRTKILVMRASSCFTVRIIAMQCRTGQIIVSSAAVIWITFAADSAFADLALGDLIRNGGSIAAGNLIFSAFSISAPNTIVVGNGSPDSVDDIQVAGITTADGSGLRFSGPFAATAVDGDRSIRQFFIQFNVDVTDSGILVAGIRHAYDFTTEGAGNVSIFTRTATLPSEGPFAQIVSPSGLDSFHVERAAQLTDAFTGEVVPVPSLRIFSGMTVQSEYPRPLPRAGSANIAFLDQTFTVWAVPEPSSLFIWFLGTICIMFWYRRRAQR
jgi:hypothetical protein